MEVELERKEVQVPRPSHCSDPDQTRHDEVMSNPLESSLPTRPEQTNPRNITSKSHSPCALPFARTRRNLVLTSVFISPDPEASFLSLIREVFCTAYAYAQLAVLGFHYLFSALVVSMNNKIQCACIQMISKAGEPDRHHKPT